MWSRIDYLMNKGLMYSFKSLYKNREKQPLASTLTKLKKSKELSGNHCAIISYLDEQWDWIMILMNRGVSLYRSGCLNPSSTKMTTFDYLKLYYKKAKEEITSDIEKKTAEIVISVVYHILSFFVNHCFVHSYHYEKYCFLVRNVLWRRLIVEVVRWRMSYHVPCMWNRLFVQLRIWQHGYWLVCWWSLDFPKCS